MTRNVLFVGAVFCVLAGCATLPSNPSERALYLDLRKAVDATEGDGWNIDWIRIQNNADAALTSTCQVAPSDRDGLERWIDAQIALGGGPAEKLYRTHGKNLHAAEAVLSLERTRALLQFAKAHAEHDCPFYLEPHADFTGVQGDAGRWVLLAETLGFATYVIDSHMLALGGGGRLLLGHGIGSRLTLAAGAELGASGSFVPSQGGLDATASLAMPILLRLARFSHLYDIELAPVARFASGTKAWPPGGRVELSYGFASMRSGAFMPFFMIYVGYEFHPHVASADADSTVLVGTRLSVDWAL